MVHIDLIQGLSSREVAVDFIHTYTSADGIISTRAPLIQRARELSMYTVMRFFLLDSMAFESIEKQLGHIRPDVVEVLPGPMPGIVKKICRLVSCPVIAGGLVERKIRRAGSSRCRRLRHLLHQPGGLVPVKSIYCKTASERAPVFPEIHRCSQKQPFPF